MKHAIFLASLCVLCALRVSTASAADAPWYKLGPATFPERRTITITNAADARGAGIPVRINLTDLKVAEDARGTAVIVDSQAAPSRDGEAGGALVPHQVVSNVLSFCASLKPKETKTFYLYTTAQEIKDIAFPPQTSADIRPGHAYRSFENGKMAYRIEVGEGSKTTGLAIDLFGKNKAGQQMGAILASKIYNSNYHKMQDWGIDILKVGFSPGLAGLYIIDGDKTARTQAKTTEFAILEGENGPILTRVRAHGPVEINGKKLDLARTLTLTADDRGIDDEVLITGDAKALEGLKLGVGILELPKNTWSEDPKAGYACVDGDGNQEGTGHLGIGVAFHANQYVRTDTLKGGAPTPSPDIPDIGGKIIVLTPQKKDAALTSHHHLGAYWNDDGEIRSKDAFESWLKDQAKLLANPPKIEVGNPEHAK